MPEPKQCSEVVDTVEETIVIGIKLVGQTAQNLDVYLANALKSADVQKALRETLTEFAGKSVTGAPLTFSGIEAQKFASALAGKSLPPLKTNLIGQIKSSGQYKRLEQSGKRVVEALKCTPAGVWFDEHQMLVYIVGGGVLVSGAAAMYVLRSGDAVTAPIASLFKDKKAITIPITGDLDLSAGGFKFTPSKREVALDLTASAKWKEIKAELTLSGHALDSQVTIGGAGKIVIPFRPFTAKLEGSYDPRNTQGAPVQLGLGFNIKNEKLTLDLMGRVQTDGQQLTGGSIDLDVDVKSLYRGAPPLRAGVTGKFDDKGDAQILGTIGWNF
jgi:hypothetical protein